MTTIERILIIVVVFVVGCLIVTQAKADDFPVYMKDGVINVTLKDGKTYTFSLNDWKVVPRVQSASEEDVVAPIAEAPAQSQEEKEEYDNRFTVHGGYGPTGKLDTAVPVPGMVVVDPDHGFVFGVTYSRKISDKFSLSGTALNNKTLLLGVGYDF